MHYYATTCLPTRCPVKALRDRQCSNNCKAMLVKLSQSNWMSSVVPGIYVSCDASAFWESCGFSEKN